MHHNGLLLRVSVFTLIGDYLSQITGDYLSQCRKLIFKIDDTVGQCRLGEIMMMSQNLQRSFDDVDDGGGHVNYPQRKDLSRDKNDIQRSNL